MYNKCFNKNDVHNDTRTHTSPRKYWRIYAPHKRAHYLCSGIRHSCDTHAVCMHRSILTMLLKAALAHDLIKFLFYNKNVTLKDTHRYHGYYCANCIVMKWNEWGKSRTETKNWIKSNERNTQIKCIFVIIRIIVVVFYSFLIPLRLELNTTRSWYIAIGS